MREADNGERRCRVPKCITILRKSNETGVCGGHPLEVRKQWELPMNVKSSSRKSYVKFNPAQIREIDSSQIKQAGSNLDRIRAAVMQAYGVELEELLGDSHLKILVRSRWMVMHLIREELGLSFSRIGEYLNKTDATIIHGCQRMEKEIANKPLIAEAVQKIREAYRPFLNKPEGCS